MHGQQNIKKKYQITPTFMSSVRSCFSD